MGCRRVLPGAAFLAAGADTIKASAPAVLFYGLCARIWTASRFYWVSLKEGFPVPQTA
jgi:hypothetical protein